MARLKKQKPNIIEENCTFCDFTTMTKKTLNEHLKDQHWELIFCCNTCNNYLPRQELMSHMRNHALSSNAAAQSIPTKKFHCTFCDSKFTTKRVLQNHELSKHSQEKRTYSCKDCGKKFKTDSTLFIHRKLHDKDKAYECMECKKSFRLKHHLNGHLLQHKKPKDQLDLPYECNICRKKFMGSDNLRKHKKIHENFNIFPCHICGAKMKQKRYLREHMLKVHLQRLTKES